ncbi:hypothetical protein PHET_04250 [Paragonimus heterotremus]|uniref:ditrans,polycis-polyprenyl diphosphate synthase [(2E,6E)-farnesyldiphosphate specific] n=1 Tax=Paragonimus heterotremus TaxID=100268 RepID=A0A8J4TM04_9TREM|nr:hypothetical protein PHET_04250 [Paragonimus heterotremus]
MKSSVQHQIYGTFLYLLLMLHNLSWLIWDHVCSLWTTLSKPNCSSICVSKNTTSSNCQRIPKHLSIVIFEDAVSVEDVANMILWAHDLGILSIALSDCKGNLLTLKTEINTRLKTNERVLTITPQSDAVYRCSIGVSGELSELTIHYHDINYGLLDMCKVAQKVCLHSERISSTVIQDASNLPNVELTIHFGNYTNLSGVFPWQCRSSEFLSTRSHWRIQQHDFLDLFSRYGRIKQRWGR